MIFLCCFKPQKDTPKQYIPNSNIGNTDKYSIDSCSRSNEFGEVTELYLVDKSMTELNEQLIFTSKNIVKMWLSKNSLSTLPVEIKEMKALTSIWLSNNLFENIPVLPERIKNIYIDNNLVVSISGIKTLLLLETLKIDCCKLEGISDEIGKCINLITLEAHKNFINNISSEIGNLINLKTLSLHSNQITYLPDEIGNLTKLSYCSLHFNEISSLPSSLSNIQSLIRLSLHNNQLNNIVSLSLKNLQVVSLFRNNIEDIPEEVCKSLVNCQKFAIQQNKISIIPQTIKYMVSLDTLWLYDNRLLSLPDELNELPNLISIWIYEDEIKRFTNIKSCLFNVKAKSINE